MTQNSYAEDDCNVELHENGSNTKNDVPDDESLDQLSETICEPPKQKKKLLFLKKILYSVGLYHDRSWSFVIPLVYSNIYPGSLVPVASYMIVERGTCVLFGTLMGYIVDKYPRLPVVAIALSVQNFSVALSGIILFLLLTVENATSNQYFPFSNAMCFILWILNTLFGSIAAMTSMMTSISIAKDWCVVLSTSFKLKLVELNSMMKRISLLCNIIAPFIVGTIITFFGVKTCILVNSIWNVVSFFPEFLCLLFIYNQTPNLARKKLDISKSDPNVITTENYIEVGKIVEAQNAVQEVKRKKSSNMGCIKFLTSWKEYFTHMITMPSIAYVLLYFTVLSTSPLLLSYLSSMKVHSLAITVFVSLSALFGVISTFISPYFVRFGGVINGGLTSLWFQYLSLTLGIGFLLGYIIFHDVFCLYIFLGLIIVSRVGLWGFDLAESEIMQIGIQENKRGRMNSIETSLTKFAEIAMYVLSLTIADPKYFLVLAIASVSFVFLACIIFSLWSLIFSSRFRKNLKVYYLSQDNDPKTATISSLDIEPSENDLSEMDEHAM